MMLQSVLSEGQACPEPLHGSLLSSCGALHNGFIWSVTYAHVSILGMSQLDAAEGMDAL